MNIKILNHITPKNLSPEWDKITNFYFQKREFLVYLHKYNFCNQRYYELYENNKLIAGTIAYTLSINLFTFSNIRLPVQMQVIGIPASIATTPIIGDSERFEFLLSEVIKREKGLILGINFEKDHLKHKVLSLRTLPTIVLDLPGEDIQSYYQCLRHNYRRRIYKIKAKFTDVMCYQSDCSFFTKAHYSLYLQIMNKTSTKLETLSYDSFKKLPSNFRLTTYYYKDVMLCWHILCVSRKLVFFYFGGMNYKYNIRFQSYNNSLLGIIRMAYKIGIHTIDLGQTAETAKTRFGGVQHERKMFLYHKNPLVFLLVKLTRTLINYSKTNQNHRVFKSNYNFSKSVVNYESSTCKTETIS